MQFAAILTMYIYINALLGWRRHIGQWIGGGWWNEITKEYRQELDKNWMRQWSKMHSMDIYCYNKDLFEMTRGKCFHLINAGVLNGHKTVSVTVPLRFLGKNLSRMISICVDLNQTQEDVSESSSGSETTSQDCRHQRSRHFRLWVDDAFGAEHHRQRCEIPIWYRKKDLEWA